MGSCQLEVLQPNIAGAILVCVSLLQKHLRQQRRAVTHNIQHYVKTASQQLWDVLNQ